MNNFDRGLVTRQKSHQFVTSFPGFNSNLFKNLKSDIYKESNELYLLKIKLNIELLFNENRPFDIILIMKL